MINDFAITFTVADDRHRARVRQATQAVVGETTERDAGRRFSRPAVWRVARHP